MKKLNKKTISFSQLKRMLNEARRQPTKVTVDMVPEKLKRRITADFGGTIYDNTEGSQTPYLIVDIPREFQSTETIRGGKTRKVLNGYKRIAELKQAIFDAGWKLNGIDSPGETVDDCYVVYISPKGMSTKDVMDDDDFAVVAESDDDDLLDAERAVARLLPHGGGIDYDWEFKMKNGSSDVIEASNAWHYMNQNGYYLGAIPFVAWIYPNGQIDGPLFRGVDNIVNSDLGKEIVANVMGDEYDDDTDDKEVVEGELWDIKDLISERLDDVKSSDLRPAVRSLINALGGHHEDSIWIDM